MKYFMKSHHYFLELLVIYRDIFLLKLVMMKLNFISYQLCGQISVFNNLFLII
jgi:hypothetical protein